MQHEPRCLESMITAIEVGHDQTLVTEVASELVLLGG